MKRTSLLFALLTTIAASAALAGGFFMTQAQTRSEKGVSAIPANTCMVIITYASGDPYSVAVEGNGPQTPLVMGQPFCNQKLDDAAIATAVQKIVIGNGWAK